MVATAPQLESMPVAAQCSTQPLCHVTELAGKALLEAALIIPSVIGATTASALSLYGPQLELRSIYYLWFFLFFLHIILICNCSQNTLFFLQLSLTRVFSAVQNYIGLPLFIYYGQTYSLIVTLLRINHSFSKMQTNSNRSEHEIIKGCNVFQINIKRFPFVACHRYDLLH